RQDAVPAVDRVRLRRPQRDRRRGPPGRRRRGRARRGDIRVVLVCARDARPRFVDPYLRRAEDLQLPPVAARLPGARVRRHALAGLRRTGAPFRTRGLRQPQAPLRRAMSPLASRIVVAAVGLPAVLGLVYAGGWWLFALVAVGALVAVHQYGLMTRSPPPLNPTPHPALPLTP